MSESFRSKEIRINMLPGLYISKVSLASYSDSSITCLNAKLPYPFASVLVYLQSCVCLYLNYLFIFIFK